MTEPTLLQQARYVLNRTTDVQSGPIDPLQFNAVRRTLDRVLQHLEQREAAMSGPAQVPGEQVYRMAVERGADGYATLVAKPEPLPALDLTELQRLCDAASPAQWALDSEELFVLDSVGTVFTLETGDDGSESLGASLAAARFAIAARDALPKLIALVRQLQEPTLIAAARRNAICVACNAKRGHSVCGDCRSKLVEDSDGVFHAR